jgi:hypothetical protein
MNYKLPLLVISCYKSRVRARKARQWACHRSLSVVCGWKLQMEQSYNQLETENCCYSVTTGSMYSYCNFEKIFWINRWFEWLKVSQEDTSIYIKIFPYFAGDFFINLSIVYVCSSHRLRYVAQRPMQSLASKLNLAPLLFSLSSGGILFWYHPPRSSWVLDLIFFFFSLALRDAFVAGTRTLRTLALRPVTLYGEGDRHFVVNSMRQARAAGGSLSRMGPTSARFSAAYVGEFFWVQQWSCGRGSRPLAF